MIIRVHYNDESVGVHPHPIAAEKEILQNFSDSDGDTRPDYVEEVDTDDNQLAVFGCTWQVVLEKL